MYQTFQTVYSLIQSCIFMQSPIFWPTYYFLLNKPVLTCHSEQSEKNDDLHGCVRFCLGTEPLSEPSYKPTLSSAIGQSQGHTCIHFHWYLSNSNLRVNGHMANEAPQLRMCAKRHYLTSLCNFLSC